MKEHLIYIMAIGLLCANESFGQTKSNNSNIATTTEQKSLEIVNRYLDTIFAEDNNGAELSDLLDDDFAFDNPSSTAKNADDFIAKVLPFIKTKKIFKMEQQFVKGDAVCSVYSFALKTANGATESFEVTAYVQLRNGKIVKEREYFSDPVKFAKAMGFLDDYLRAYK